MSSTPDEIQRRLEAGQKFNAYHTASPDRYVIGIGPVSDVLGLAQSRSPEFADYLVDALRGFVGQAPALVTLAERDQDA